MLGGEAEDPVIISLIQKSLLCRGTLQKTHFIWTQQKSQVWSRENMDIPGNTNLQNCFNMLTVMVQVLLWHLDWLFTRFFLLFSYNLYFSASIFLYISILSHCYLQVMFSAVPTYHFSYLLYSKAQFNFRLLFNERYLTLSSGRYEECLLFPFVFTIFILFLLVDTTLHTACPHRVVLEDYKFPFIFKHHSSTCLFLKAKILPIF